MRKVFSIDTGLDEIRGMELSSSSASSSFKLGPFSESGTIANASSSANPTANAGAGAGANEESESESDTDTVGYLAAAGQVGGGIKIFARTSGGKKLVEVASFGVRGVDGEQPDGARNVTTFLWL